MFLAPVAGMSTPRRVDVIFLMFFQPPHDSLLPSPCAHERVILKPLDMMNHDHLADQDGLGTDARHNAVLGRLEVVSVGELEKGSECHYFYGDLCKTDFQMFYGFDGGKTTRTSGCDY